MKKIIKYIVVVIVLLSAASCELERENYTEIYPDNFYKNETDIILAVNDLYSPFITYWGNLYCANYSGYPTFSELTTDAYWSNYGGSYDDVRLHKWAGASTAYEMILLETMFRNYNFISKARNVVRHIEQSSVSQLIKDKYIGEANALRGWMGLILYDMFGPVPVASDEVLDNPATFVYLPRLTEEEYREFMESTLIDAINKLPVNQSVRGRVTKGFAQMVLAKYYMIRKDFVNAEKLCRDIISLENSVYELLPDYFDVFKYENQGNKEVIHAILTDRAYRPNYWHAHVVPDDYPIPSGITVYAGMLIPWDFIDTFEENDERLKGILTSYKDKNGNMVNRGYGKLVRGAYPALKYSFDPNQQGEGSSNDYVVFRYADVLLMLAECINENAGPTAEAVALVNRIRSRAGLSDLSSAQTSAKDVLNSAILLERGHELYAEGFRRQDLIRHGKYIEEALKIPGSLSAPYKVRFPIPRSIIQESKDMVKQNDGY